MFADLILSTVIKQILATRIHSQPSSNNISSVFGISKHEKILLAIAIHPRSAPVGWRETKFAYRILSEYFSAYARYIAHYDSCGLMPGSNSRFVVRARYTVDRHWLCVRNLKKKTAANGNYNCGYAVNSQTVLRWSLPRQGVSKQAAARQIPNRKVLKFVLNQQHEFHAGELKEFNFE